MILSGKDPQEITFQEPLRRRDISRNTPRYFLIPNSYCWHHFLMMDKEYLMSNMMNIVADCQHRINKDVEMQRYYE